MKNTIRLSGPKGLVIMTQGLLFHIDSAISQVHFSSNHQDVWQMNMYLNYPPQHDDACIMGQIDIYPQTDESIRFLAQNSVELRITEDDLRNVLPDCFVIKAACLPDRDRTKTEPNAGLHTIVSSYLRLEIDAIEEAAAIGRIVAVLRLGQDRNFPLGGFPAFGSSDLTQPKPSD